MRSSEIQPFPNQSIISTKQTDKDVFQQELNKLLKELSDEKLNSFKISQALQMACNDLESSKKEYDEKLTELNKIITEQKVCIFF